MRIALLALLSGCVAQTPMNHMENPPDDAPDLTPASNLPDMATTTQDLAQSASDLAQAPLPVGTATLSGSVGAYSIPSVKSVFAVVSATSFSIYVSDRDDLCKVLQDGSTPKNTHFLRFGSVAGGSHTFPAGSYAYPSGAGSGSGGGSGGGGGGGGGGDGTGMGTRNGLIATTNANCMLMGYDKPSAGNFTITAAVDANSQSVEGTFDLTFTPSTLTGTLTGSFTAPVCAGATEIPFAAVYCE